MSSSQAASGPNLDSLNSFSDDALMMEAPDSPPDQSHGSINGQFVDGPASGNHFVNSLSPGSHQSKSSLGGRMNAEGFQKITHGAPGSSWQSKKFNEDYEKAFSNLMDQNWDNAKYGDPLLQGPDYEPDLTKKWIAY